MAFSKDFYSTPSVPAALHTPVAGSSSTINVVDLRRLPALRPWGFFNTYSSLPSLFLVGLECVENTSTPRPNWAL